MFEGMVERAFSRSSNLESIESRTPLNLQSDPLKTNSAAAGSKPGH
jgi:hypothetical protein